MSQHFPPHHFHTHLAPQLAQSPTQYTHYPPPQSQPPLALHLHNNNINHAIAPQDTTRQPLTSLPSPIARSPSLSHQQGHPQLHHQLQKIPSAPLTNGTTNSGPLVATGDWTKDLIHLAKTAELKKHALTLQLHTAHILSAHASLEQKSKTIQDIREQRNKLDSERARLLNSLREINEDRDKADLMEVSINKECEELRRKIEHLAEGEYSFAKRDVDRLRAELGQPPVPSLQATLEEKRSQYLFERRMNGTENSMACIKRNGMESSTESSNPSGKRPRGRPKGSKNRAKNVATSDAPPASSS